MDNALVKFVTEFVSRLLSKNPKFFDKIQLVSIVVGAVSTLVHYLQSSGVELPKLFAALDNLTVVATSVITIILAQLPNDTGASK